jgi:cytoskeletal protein RodZ
VFEIGNSLREARLRQQLQFSVLEERTKVRPKYLRALEDEQFDVLPAPTYVKGFLKAYADALGLDGQLYVDEFNSRFVAGEEEAPFRPKRNPSARAARRVETSAVLIAVVAILLVTGLVIVAFTFGDGSPKPQPLDVPTQAAVAPRTHQPVHKAAKPRTTVVLTAARGDSVLEVHALSITGPILFQGTLLQGKSQRFSGRLIWVRAGAPANLDARVNGVAIPLVAGTAPAKLVFGPHGQLTG